MYSEQERTPDFQEPVAMRLMILNLRTGHRDVHEFPKETLIATGCWMGGDRTVLLAMKKDWTDETSFYNIYRYDLQSRQSTILTNLPKGHAYAPHWISGSLSVSPAGKQPLQWGAIKKFLQTRGKAFKTLSRNVSIFLPRVSNILAVYSETHNYLDILFLCGFQTHYK